MIWKLIKKIRCSCLNVCRVEINNEGIELDLTVRDEDGTKKDIRLFKISYV